MERLKNMGLKKSFLLLSLSCLAVAFLLLGAVIFLCRGIENYYPLGRCRNPIGWFNRTPAISYDVTTAHFGYPKYCADAFLYSFPGRWIDCFSLSFLLSQIEAAYFLPAKWHYADSE